MARWKYRKPEPSTQRGFCVICKKYLQKGRKRKDKKVYLPYCSTCEKSLYQKTYTKYVAVPKIGEYYKKASCDNCGFKADHLCQLDIDHIDGNSSNNDIKNLQTLCANCHRLKTWIFEDWKPLT
jgi:5-methylcytosine-specific restriction endonuclease McrA